MGENVRVHAYASGRVQGVFYRENTKQKAQELSVTGLVRNLEDGRVEAVAEGEEEKVKELLDWMQEGPSAARVDNLEVNWEDYKGEFDEFEVKL